jgi:hypothetical protein
MTNIPSNKCVNAFSIIIIVVVMMMKIAHETKTQWLHYNHYLLYFVVVAVAVVVDRCY